PSVDNTVSTLFISGSVIYAGGSFTGSLEAINFDGTVHGQFHPVAEPPCGIEAILASGDNVFVGGSFNLSIGDRPRNYFAVLDTSGHGTTWDPYASSDVKSFALNGNTLYVGGTFQELGGTSHDGLGALDLTTGRFIDSFVPELSVDTRALAVSGGVLY